MLSFRRLVLLGDVVTRWARDMQQSCGHLTQKVESVQVLGETAGLMSVRERP